MNYPRVTVAVVCFNEERNIIDCLSSLLDQSYGPKRYEILVVDNNSTDKTRQLVKGLQKKYRQIKLVVNKKRGIAASRNVALRQVYPESNRRTQGKLLAFTDADCIVPKDWLSNLVKGYQKYTVKDQKVVAVGGSNVPPTTSDYYRALSIMLNSFLGSRGSVQGRQFKTDRYVPHLPCVNILFNKEKLIETGGFDEKLGNIIEDEDLTYRLSQKGYRFYYLKNAPVMHKMRSNIHSWAKNMFTYGKGRMWFLQKHPEKIHLYFLVPIFLVLTFPISLPIYLPLIFLYAIWISSKNEHLKLFPQVFCLLAVTHLSYGVGEIYGMVKGKN